MAPPWSAAWTTCWRRSVGWPPAPSAVPAQGTAPVPGAVPAQGVAAQGVAAARQGRFVPPSPRQRRGRFSRRSATARCWASPASPRPPAWHRPPSGRPCSSSSWRAWCADPPPAPRRLPYSLVPMVLEASAGTRDDADMTSRSDRRSPNPRGGQRRAGPQGAAAPAVELPALAQHALDTFIAHLRDERGLAANTVAAYERDVVQFFLFAARGRVVDPGGVDPLLLRRFLAQLATRGLAASSIARKAAALRACFRLLARRGLVDANPAAGLGSPRGPRRLPVVLKQRQVEELLARPRPLDPVGLRDRAILELLYATGMRVGELCALELGDVDLASELVRVHGQGGRERLVPFGEPARAALLQYLIEGRRVMLPATGGGRRAGAAGGRALFFNQRARPMTPRDVRGMVQHYRAGPGVPSEASPHTLRHSRS